jgi:VanZ family protein
LAFFAVILNGYGKLLSVMSHINSKFQNTPSHLPGRTYFCILLAYLAFVLYGSLVPCRFIPTPPSQAWAHFLQVIEQTPKITSKSDFIANYFLFMPLTFLALGAFTRENTRPQRWLFTILIWLAACAFGAGIELIQNFFPARTVSLTDILAQAIGGIIGIIFWFWFGNRFTAWARALWHEHIRGRLAVKLLLAYALALAAYLLLPLDLTLSPNVIYHKLKAGGLVLLPFNDVSDLWNPTIRLGRMIPIGILAALLVRRKDVCLQAGLFGGLLFAGTVEFMQLFVESRVSSLTDVTLALIAGGLGGWLVRFFLTAPPADPS